MSLPFTDEELTPAVDRVLDKVRPVLERDKGGVKLIAVRGGVVYVQLTGGCVGCASSGTTLKFTIERQLQMDIHPLMKVVNVPEGMEAKLEEIRVG